MADDPRWKEPRVEPKQDTSLFDVLEGEEGEEFREVPIKGKPLEEPGPAITPKAQEALDEYNKSAKDDKKLELGKIKGTGKDNKVTAQDISREKLSKNPPAATGVRPNPGNEPEPDEYDKDRTVYYAGHQVPVPDRTMKLEEIRAMIEEQWPELSKENTDMVYDKERGAVIPVLKGHRKGGVRKRSLSVVLVDPTAEEFLWPVSYVLAEDGYTYMLRRTQTGDFVTRVNGVLGVCEGFKLKVPHIPASLLRQAIEGFQSQEKTEMMCNFVWHAPPIERYGLMFPEQKGDATSVQAGGMMETRSRFIVLQMHSHGIMPAFFSPADDADELRTGLYGVVGHCDRKWPDLKLRYSNAGEFREVMPEEIFGIGWSGVVEHDG